MLDHMSILMVEDDSIDAETVKRSVAKLGVNHSIVWAKDGLEALEILENTHSEKTVQSPFIVLLDINLPRVNGIEFLEKIRANAQLRSTIVFVLTTSNQQTDIQEAYAHNVAGYFLKKNAGEDFMDAIQILHRYWRHAEIPIA